MLKYIVDTRQKRDIILIYAVADPAELAYTVVLDQAARHGVTIIRLLTTGKPPQDWPGETGTLDAAFITGSIHDLKDRTVYISGPDGLVRDLRGSLRRSGVPADRLRTDYFTGY
jgi:ferredoxin-NADP reductase